MAFIDIKDPRKRDEIVADYLSTIRRVQQRNEDERAVGLARQVVLEKTFNPLIKATEKSTKAITEELQNINKPTPPPPPPTAVRRKRTWTENYGSNALDYYLNEYNKKDLDKYYGIQSFNDDLMMGEKEIIVDENSDIKVDETTYKGTPGLWSLVMQASPKEYTEDDFEKYRDLVMRTDVISHPRGVVKGISRPAQTYKRKMILNNFIQQNDEEDNDGEETKEDGGEYSGTGVIQFLPGDIKGLSTKLNLLLAEYVAGNRSPITRNQIVGIIDELKRRKRISRKEYTDINIFLSKTL